MNLTKKETDANFGGKPAILDTNKSSMQILSELFSTFDAEPPIIVKKEKKEKSSDSSKKSKKSKKKRKHKEKKHKKKSKKKKKSSSSSSNSSSDESEIDLAQLLIKQEKDKADEKIKIEGTSLSLDIKLEINKEEQKIKSDKGEKSDKSHHNDTKQKIHIKDLQLSSVKKDIIAQEEGEIIDSDSDTKKRKKHKHKEKDKSKKRKSISRETSENREKKLKHDNIKQKVKKERLSPEPEKHRHKSRHESRDRSLFRNERRSRERSRSREHFYHDKYRDDHKYDYRSKYKDRDQSFRDDGFYKFRDRSRSRERDKAWLMRDRYRSHNDRDRSAERNRTREKEDSSRIDKKKLLEIARRNAIQMMKSGSLPGALSLGSKAQEKMIAAIKSGGKTIEELTDFCKSLSRKEEMGELSSLSEKEDTDTDEPFHHPFKIKDRPTTITMNIKNSVPLPTKTTQERTTELRMQFPVSSGQQHRVNEEWIPVSPPTTKTTVVTELSKPKLTETAAPVDEPVPKSVSLANVPLPPEPIPALIPAPPNAPPGPQIFPSVSSRAEQPAVDISSIVTQRLTAMRRLQENPNDVQALNEMYKSNKEMEYWAKSKQQLGQFTGSTGAQVLSQAELASGFQAWAKRDQLQTAAPVSGGMGMHLLQKMGWKPGEGLGKEKTGALEPLLLEVKLDKKGLVATEEQTKGKRKLKTTQTVKTLQGKHPVSLLGEYASKRKLGAPQYILEFECGPDHKKNFLFKVVLNDMEYKPNVASASKKEAKANAATIALKQIGLLV